MREQKTDPEKRCEWCETPLTRKRFSTGRLEDRGRFLKRRFCDTECQRAAQINPDATNRQGCHNRHHFQGVSHTASTDLGPSETRSSRRSRSGSAGASSSTKKGG